LTGALLVGDSLRGSLRDLTEARLGWVDQAVLGSRFFRATLADDLPAERTAPAILLQAIADQPDGRSVRRITLFGIDHRFGLGNLETDSAVLGANLARELDAHVGDTVTFRIQKPSNVPREGLLGQRGSDAFAALRFRVSALLPEGAPAARFSLRPGLDAPRNAFVPLAALQELLDQREQANVLLVGGPRSELPAAFRSRIDLEDWGLRLTTPHDRARELIERYDANGDGRLSPSEWYKGLVQGHPLAQFATTYAWGMLDPDRKAARLPRSELDAGHIESFFRTRYPYFSLESRQLIIEPLVADAAIAAALESEMRAAPTLVYLSKLDGHGKRIAGVVTAADPTLSTPLGPFLPPGKTRLADDEIALVAWHGEPSLPALKEGEEVTLTYKPPEHQPGALPDRHAKFRYAGSIPLAGAADDPDLTPPFPGITDKDNPAEWKLPFENASDPAWSTNTIRREYGDPLYWGEQRTTPRAYITLDAGRKLWSSRFGDLTSIRLVPKEGGDLNAAAERFRAALRKHLDPDQGNLALMPLKRNALAASNTSTDFSGLFLGFSGFLILAALLLVGLLFRLNVDRRASELGLLLAAGYRRTTLRNLLLAESGLLALTGGLAGLAGGLLYAAGLLEGFARWWPGLANRSFLRLHVEPMSFVYGFGGMLLMSMLTIIVTVRSLAKVAPSALLAGESTPAHLQLASSKPRRWGLWLCLGSLVFGTLAIAAGGFVGDHEARAGSFFTGGMLLLVAGLTALWIWMRRTRHGLIHGHGGPALARLGIRNVARHTARSLLTAGLLASSAYLLVAVESFRRHPESNFLDKHSGSGGFALLGESELPFYQDLNQGPGHQALLDKLASKFEAQFPRDTHRARAEMTQARSLLDQLKFISLRVRQGDDASCLNLYQPRQPRLIGVPDQLIERGGFQFAGTEAQTSEERANPWRLLDREGPTIPVVGEANTVIWMLKSGLGKELQATDDHGQPVRLRIVALLQDSVFQNGLLMSEKNLLKLYPGLEGYSLFLAEAPASEARQAANYLELAMADRGLEVTPTADRLASYLDVENTYLSTFQALGGLGMILGSFGLAVVLLRSIWERRGELALLRALGYRHSALRWLLLAENGFLALVGLAIGAATALLSVAPHLLTGAGAVPWARLAVFLVLAMTVGLAAGAVAVMTALRGPLLLALRRD
jgi:ABC-type lipoprotein release transport system permease subunit